MPRDLTAAPKKRFRYYALWPDGGGVKGLVRKKPKIKKQDRRAKPVVFYAVVFFPRIDSIGPARMDFFGVRRTLAQTPEAARTKFMDSIAPGEKWETYHKAGHRIRRVKITDLGESGIGAMLGGR